MNPFQGRREDRRFLSGLGCYTSDCNLPGQLHASFLRADRAHAAVRSVNKAAAEAAPGVRAVLTGGEILDAGLRRLQPLVSYPGRGGMRILVPERSLLAYGRVRYVGEAVALVIADSAQAAVSAAELIEVDYEDLPAVIGFDHALAAGAPLVHAEIPGNVCFDFDYGDEKRAAEAIERAAHVVRVTMESPRVAPAPMEPRAVLAAYDAAVEQYVIRCEHQGASAMRDALAAMLGVDARRVRVEFVGAKGVGEAGTTGGLPACMNAVLDALRSAGVAHFDMPASPARVWGAIRQAKK